MALINPDDDTLEEADVYVPRYKDTGARRRMSDFQIPEPTQAHCGEHAVNLGFFREVKNRQNIIIGGVGFIIMGMAWMYLTLYALNSTTAINSLKITNLESGYLNNRADINALKTGQTSNEEWHRMIEMREGISHSSGGATENHHVGATK